MQTTTDVLLKEHVIRRFKDYEKMFYPSHRKFHNFCRCVHTVLESKTTQSDVLYGSILVVFQTYNTLSSKFQIIYLLQEITSSKHVIRKLIDLYYEETVRILQKEA